MRKTLMFEIGTEMNKALRGERRWVFLQNRLKSKGRDRRRRNQKLQFNCCVQCRFMEIGRGIIPTHTILPVTGERGLKHKAFSPESLFLRRCRGCGVCFTYPLAMPGTLVY